MSKCIYDLSEDCDNTDCLTCVLDKIRAEIEQARDKLKKIPYDTGSDRNNAFIDNVLSANVEFCNDLLQILDKYKGESEDKE